ncbi:MAG: glycosyl transferase, family 2 [Polaromonas sp.]|nr:glycosyl transferase, family 2 [Polaromonas sp.]
MKPENFANNFSPTECRVSIIIKALNEEKRIEAAIESALRAVQRVGGEVVLADSYSTDKTVELAMAYPIRIVKLANAEDRCCGVGPQLGYQHSRGEFVYLLDGDMQMLEGFLEVALDFMLAHPDIAGVGGQLVELNTESLEYIARSAQTRAHVKPGEVDRLDGGGLYRRSAIEAAGYFSDRNLHSYEEFDLAVRLRSLGWKLWRLPMDVVHHRGHDAPAYQLLMRRWQTQYLWGLGELVRASAGQLHLKMVFQGLRELWIYVGMLAWWSFMLSIPFWPASGVNRLVWFGLSLTAPLALMIWRKRSFSKALYSVVSWSFNAAGLVRGVLRPRRPANAPIPSLVLREPHGLSSLSTPGVSH